METLTLTILTLDLAGNRRSSRRRRGMSPRWSCRSWRGWALRTIWEWRRSVQRWRRWRFWEEASHWTQSFLLFSPFLPYFFSGSFFVYFWWWYLFILQQKALILQCQDLKPWVLLQLQYRKKKEEEKKKVLTSFAWVVKLDRCQNFLSKEPNVLYLSFVHIYIYIYNWIILYKLSSKYLIRNLHSIKGEARGSLPCSSKNSKTCHFVIISAPALLHSKKIFPLFLIQYKILIFFLFFLFSFVMNFLYYAFTFTVIS